MHTVSFIFLSVTKDKEGEDGQTMISNKINVIYRVYLFNKRRINRILPGKSIYILGGAALLHEKTSLKVIQILRKPSDINEVKNVKK